jgi:hypothetical protein
MTLSEAITVIKDHLGRMDDLYCKKVFDEWAIIRVEGSRGRILAYEGQRREDFTQSFPAEVKAFGPELLKSPRAAGDYDFFRHATGMDFDAYLALNAHLFLICNNTAQSMTGITEDPLWLKAQAPFVEMSEKFRSDPVLPS